MGRSKDLAKNTAILTFGKICTQSISFFMLPLYTSLLNTAEYGLFDLLVTYAALLLPLVNWQLDQGLFRFMLDVRGQADAFVLNRLFDKHDTVCGFLYTFFYYLSFLDFRAC